MTAITYHLQTLVIAGTLFAIVWNEDIVLRLQILVWTVGVIAIAWRYGPISQAIEFYSNDQWYYVRVVNRYILSDFPTEYQEILSEKVPFTLPAALLVLVGVNTTLSLKVISLLCLLAVTKLILNHQISGKARARMVNLYLSGCGPIGLFFSVLALRETMLMLFAYLFVTSKSALNRVLSIILLYLLRNHLAVAFLLSEIVLQLRTSLIKRVRHRIAEVSLWIVAGIFLGTMLITWAVSMGTSVRTPLNGGWGLTQAVRAVSNFVGLQFLVAPEGTVNFSLPSLLVLRILFSETIMIPLCFTVACFLYAHRLRHRHLLVLLSFTVYTSIATNTDFNSFRQNIPFIPLMGLAVLDLTRARFAGLVPKSAESSLRYSARITPRGM